MPMPDDEANVDVIVANLKAGLGALFGTQVLRSLFLVGALMFFSFGLWNVLLLPMSLRELHATEFEYGLQEGLTSVGFVLGSLFMARFSGRLPESLWVFVGLLGMGICGVAYASATSIPLAILLVMISGFFNSPTSVARSVLLQRNTPRDLRGRVFSAYYVMRDVIFLLGMAGAGLADIVNVRILITFASILLFGAAAYAIFAPGLGLASLRAARARLEGAAGAPALAIQTSHAGRLRHADRKATDVRASQPAPARGVPPRCPGARGSRRDTHRRARRHRICGVLHPRRVGDGGHPRGGRLSRAVDDGRGRLLRRDRGTDR
jgi:MFS family permease